MRKITKRTAVVAAAVAVAVGGAGAAFATWGLNSSYNATTTAGSAVPLQVSGLQIVGTLVPGTPVSVKFNAKNTNTFAVTISKATFSEVHTLDETKCAPGNLVAPDASLGLSFAGNETKNDITLTNALNLKQNPDDGCQKAQFSFKINLVVASNDTV
jgi:hypothetical protein